MAFAALAFAAGASAWHDLRPARANVLAARAQLERVLDPTAFSTPDLRQASRNAIGDAHTRLRSARRRVGRSPGIWLAQFVPGLRRQRSALLTLLDDAQAGTQAAGSLIDRAQALAGRGQLQEGSIPLDGLDAVATEAGRAGRVFAEMRRSSAGLWGPLRTARRRLNRVAASASASLSGASDVLRVSPGFFGGKGPRRYLLAMQNNAEMRDQGMVLSYALLDFPGGGRFEFGGRGNIGQLRLDRPAPTPIPPGTQEVFGSIAPTQTWQSVNATADFSWSGRAMADMYLQATGQSVDGVIAVDVPALAELLRAVGPVTVSELAQPLTAENAARILLHDLYVGLAPRDSQAERKERLNEVTEAVVERLSTGSRDLFGLGVALSRAATGGHLRLWSRVPAEEEAFVGNGLGGGPGVTEPDRTFHVAVENRTATKLDYFVHASVHQELRFSGRNDVVVRTRVVVENRAPRGAAPSYQLGPDEFMARPGDYAGWVLLWGPAGAVQPASTPESGLTLTQGHLTVGAGETGEVVFDTLVPGGVRDGRLRLRLVPQPRLFPMDLTVTLDPRGRRVEGPTSWQGPWDQTRTMSWRVRP